MALIYRQTGVTLSATGIAVTITHALGVTPGGTYGQIVLTPQATTATGGVSVISATSQIATICAYGVANGLTDVTCQAFHTIIL